MRPFIGHDIVAKRSLCSYQANIRNELDCLFISSWQIHSYLLLCMSLTEGLHFTGSGTLWGSSLLFQQSHILRHQGQ
jgi:hypothetical protein